MTYYFFFLLTVGVLAMIVIWGVRAEIAQEREWEADNRRRVLGAKTDRIDRRSSRAAADSEAAAGRGDSDAR